MPTYKCNACNYKSTVKSNMNKHKATSKHIENLKNFKGRIMTVSNKKKTTPKPKKNDVKYTCEHCNNEFNTNSSLLRHQRRYCKENEMIAIKKQLNNQLEINKKQDEQIDAMKLKINKLKSEINEFSLLINKINLIIFNYDEILQNVDKNTIPNIKQSITDNKKDITKMKKNIYVN